MAISAVSAVSYGSNYNNLSFEGKKKTKHQKHGISTPISHKLAVPLAATILAMSPTTSHAGNRVNQIDKTNHIEVFDNVQDEGKIVAKNNFKNIYNYDPSDVLIENVTVKLINSKDNSNNFDKIMYNVQMNDPSIGVFNAESEHPITGFSDVTYEFLSDDGTKGPVINIRSIDVEGNNSPKFVKDDQAKYIKEAINSPQNKTNIKVQKYTRDLRHTSVGLQNVGYGDVMKNAVQNNYGKDAGSQEFEIASGKYKIGYYSTDDNMDDAEIVTLKKGDYPELKVSGVQIHNAVFNSNSSNPIKIRYAIVKLSDNNREYTLFDEQLASVMLQVFENKACKPAAEKVEIYQTTPARYSTTNDGILVPILDFKD